MNCPFCHAAETRVLDSRSANNGNSVRRRRQCQICQRRFTTFEYVETLDLIIIKRTGKREPYKQESLRSGIAKACAKRPVTRDQIDALVADIESKAHEQEEIQSQELGLMVLKGLRAIDSVAYLRFASVYKEFNELSDFHEELHSLMKSD